jgi:hypothetical protein
MLRLSLHNPPSAQGKFGIGDDGTRQCRLPMHVRPKERLQSQSGRIGVTDYIGSPSATFLVGTFALVAHPSSFPVHCVA